MLCESCITMLGISLLVLLFTCDEVAPSSEYWEYAVIGAGPAGLQMGYYLQKAGRQYVIMERNNISGSFYAKYPRHGKLVSINKRHTGKTNKEFNMRHDWNSLLSDREDMLLRHYSQDFFPKREALVDYLNDFTKTFNLNVRYNTEVSNISKAWNSTEDNGGGVGGDVGGSSGDYWYHMHDQHGNTYQCKYLIVATGMAKPNIPNATFMQYSEGYEDISVDPTHYEGKNVLIMGHGNSAFEVADAIYGHANVVHLVGRSRLRLAWSTHYVGDVRSVNNGLLDTYQLKSLDGLLEGSFSENIVSVTKDNHTGKVHIELVQSLDKDNFALRDSYDHLIRCLGFTFDDDLFHKYTKPLRGVGKKEKYPLIEDSYEVTDHDNMYIAGTAAHSLDYRKAAGGFIHGFRYSVRALHHILEQKNHQMAWPVETHPVTSLLSVLVKRMNEADGLYQMFGQLGDVILLSGNDSFDVVKDFPVNLLDRFETVSGHFTGGAGIIVLIMQYGHNFSGPNADVFREDRAVGNADVAHKSNFLHPTLYYYPKLPTDKEMDSRGDAWPLPKPDRIHHIVEDFLTDWTGAITHILPLRRFLQYCTGTDLRFFIVDECLAILLTHTTAPLTCRDLYLQQRQGIMLHPDLLQKIKAPELDNDDVEDVTSENLVDENTVFVDSEVS